ncbi:MAG TPA: hypothetical protein VKA31_11325 [Mariprofundaceae bacterium]|nr:hypothetical protein [Mariprofundaceae bacterium]
MAQTETSFAFHNMEYDQFSSYNKRIRELTGEVLPNPLDGNGPFAAEAPGAFEFNIADWFKQVKNLRGKYPALPQIDHERLLADIAKSRKDVRDRRAEVASRETGLGNAAASFLGGAGGAMTDPLVLGSMAFGGGAAQGFIRNVLTQALIGAGSEVGVQAAVQATRSQIPGEQPSFYDAATAVLSAGAGAGILTGVIHGGVWGVRSLIRRSKELPKHLRTDEVKVAEKLLERQMEMEQHNPFPDTIPGRMEHVRRLDEAMYNLARPEASSTYYNTTTAVGRVLPQDVRPDLPVINAGETLDEYVARVRQSDPILFQELDQTVQRTSEIDNRLKAIEIEQAATPLGDTGKLADYLKLSHEQKRLSEARRSTANRRKLQRVERKLREADIKGGGELRAARAQVRLAEEKGKLKDEFKSLQKKQKQLERQTKRLVKKTKRLAIGDSSAPVKAAIANTVWDQGTKDLAGFMADLGARMRQDAQAASPLAPWHYMDNIDHTPQDALTIDPEIEKAVKDEGRIEEELAAAVEQTPDRQIELTNEDGTTFAGTFTELKEALDSDKKLYDELLNCLNGGA